MLYYINYLFFDIRKQEGFLRTMIIRTSIIGEIMVIICFYYEDKKLREKLLEHIIAKFPQINSLMYAINNKKNDSITDIDINLYYGKDYIYEKIDNLMFKIGAKSFYQTNSIQIHKII